MANDLTSKSFNDEKIGQMLTKKPRNSTFQIGTSSKLTLGCSSRTDTYKVTWLLQDSMSQ